MTQRLAIMSELTFRILVLDPPPRAVFWLQRGKTDLVPPTSTSDGQLSFEGTLRVERRPPDLPNFLGPFAQGPPTGRFVYINSRSAGIEAARAWTRRAKVHLSGISWELIEEALSSGSVLEARIAGTGKGGGPACATVPLLDGGWKVSAG
jgi:hypothetical protein